MNSYVLHYPVIHINDLPNARDWDPDSNPDKNVEDPENDLSDDSDEHTGEIDIDDLRGEIEDQEEEGADEELINEVNPGTAHVTQPGRQGKSANPSKDLVGKDPEKKVKKKQPTAEQDLKEGRLVSCGTKRFRIDVDDEDSPGYDADKDDDNGSDDSDDNDNDSDRDVDIDMDSEDDDDDYKGSEDEIKDLVDKFFSKKRGTRRGPG